VDEFGYENTRFLGSCAHGQLVAEMAHGGQAHAGDAQVLTERGDILHIEFVERHDAIDALRASDVTHRINQALQRKILRHRKRAIKALPRPVPIL